MARRIDRSRIDAGKVDLPRKLAFLTSEKVDYLAVTEREGDYTVEVPSAALSRLVKARAELKALKSDQRSAAKTQGDAAAAAAQAHEATKAELAKALRRIKALDRKLEGGDPGSTADAAVKPGKKTAKAATPAAAKQAEAVPAAELVHSDPAAPAKVSPRNPVAAAVDSVAAGPGDAPVLPGA